MITGILLAAGRSQRMGQPKLLLPWGNLPLVRHAVQIALDSKLDEVIVVTGYLAEHIAVALHGLPMKLVHNAAFLEGQSTSVRAGVEALDADVEAVVMLLADQPLLQASTIDALLDTFRHQQAPIVVPRYNGQRGNPVLFARSLFGELLMLAGDQGARPVLAMHAEDIRFVDVADEGMVLDLDTPEAYQRLWAHRQMKD
jgi:molybdenum cofactor cytidylyltransferase